MIISIIYLLYTQGNIARLFGDDNLDILYISLSLFVKTNPAKIYNFVIKNKSWPLVQRFKKHRSLDHYKKLNWQEADSLTSSYTQPIKTKVFLNLEKDGKVNQVYIKLHFYLLNCSLIFGSSKDLSARFKFH